MAYYSLFTGTNKTGRDEGIYLNRYEYDNGYTLFAFDLTPDLSADGGHLNLIKEGNLGRYLTMANQCFRGKYLITNLAVKGHPKE